MILQTKDKPVNRITLYTQFNYAFRNYYFDEYEGVPDDTIGSPRNSFIRFFSHEKGTATVDWGDGNTETFEFRESTNNFFVCAWRTLKIDYLKNSQSSTKGWALGYDKVSGEEIIPYPNHKYEDGDINGLRTITITFSNEIYDFTSELNKMVQVPIIELPALKTLNISYPMGIKEIPLDRISKLKDLETLTLTYLGNRLEYIPDSIFELKKLKIFRWGNGLNLSNIPTSNISRIGELTNLQLINIGSCYLREYLNEFNQLPSLSTLYIGESNNNYITFHKVEKINPAITQIHWISSFDTSVGNKVEWGEDITGKGLENLTALTTCYGPSLRIDKLPDYLKEMRSLASWVTYGTFTTLERMNAFVDIFYEYILNWEVSTMTSTAKDQQRNQFYGLKINTYNPAAPTSGVYPSGILRAPEGFVQGVNNGTPTTPMEKIYVLTQNYKQTWEIKPEETTTRTARSPRQLEYNQIIDNTMVVGPEGVVYKNEIVTLTDKELEQIEQNRVSY